MRLLVALDVVRLVLVPVVVRRRLALRRRQVGPNAGRVRSVSLANLVLDRPGHLDRPPDVLRLNELRFLGDRDVARGSDEATEFPEPQAQPLVLVVQRLCTPSGLVDHDPDRIARRGRNALVDRNLLRDELHELRAVDVGVRHRRLDEHLVSGTRDPRAQRRQDVRQVLDVARADEDEVARNALDLHARPRALRIPAGDREALLLHGGEDEPLEMAEQRQLVDEQDALVGFVDRACDHAIVRLGAELRMAAVRIVTDVPKEFRLACAGREDKRPPGNRDEYLARTLLLHLPTLLERLLVEHADHVARPLVHDDLFLAELLPRGRHAIPALELREGDLEDAAEQVAERIPDVRLGGGLRSSALRAHPVRRRGVRPAVDALVAKPLRHVDRRFFRINQVAFRAGEPILLLQDLVPLLHLDQRPFRILRIMDDSNLFRDRWQVQGESLGDHRLARARRADEEEMPPLVRSDPRERNRFVLADDPLQRIVRYRDLRRRVEVVEGEAVLGGDHLRSRDTLHPRLRCQVAPRPDLDAGGLLRDRAHFRANDRVHVHLGRDVEDPLRDDAVEDDGARLLRALKRLDGLSHRDLRHDAVSLVQKAGGRGAAELQEDVTVLLELRVEDLRRRRQRRRRPFLAGFPRLSRFRPELGPRFGPGLRRTRGLRFGELGLCFVDVAGETVHLDVLIRRDLVPQALHDLLLRELFDFLASRGTGDEVDLGHLEEFLQDQVSAAVAIDEGGERSFFRELLDRLRDVRPLDRDGILDPRPEEVQDVLAPFDDDDRVAVGDVRSGGKPLGPERHDLRHLHALAHLVEEVRPGGLRLLDHGREQGAGSLDDLVALRDAGVLDLVDLDRGLARADAVDRLEGRRQDRGLDLVQRGRDQDRAFAPAFLALDVDLDSADAAALLQVSQVQFLAEEPFRLAEHGPDDVGFLDDPFRLQAGLDEIFSRTRIDVHFRTCPG